MIKKKKSKLTKKNLKKVWEKTKKTAKVVQKEVAKAGRGLERVGKGLSASGDVIQESFKPPTSKEKQIIPQQKLIGKREPYEPYGYKKTLSFGWGGY